MEEGREGWLEGVREGGMTGGRDGWKEGGRKKERRIRQAEGSVLPGDGVLDWKP